MKLIEWTINAETAQTTVKTGTGATRQQAIEKAAFKLFGKEGGKLALSFNRFTVIGKKTIETN
jgi:hypothetical protein